MPQAFISYASQDATFADLAKLKLKEAGINVWLDHGELRAGDEWRNAIDDGISSSETLIVIVSPSSCNSPYVTYEWAFAMGKGKKVIPLLLEDAEMHPRLAVLQYLDFRTQRTGPWEELFQGISGNHHKPRPHSETDECAIARDRILEYLERKQFKKIRFRIVRERIDPKYDDEFLFKVIRENHKQLRSETYKGERAVARILA
jgi:hypothetical protein